MCYAVGLIGKQNTTLEIYVEASSFSDVERYTLDYIKRHSMTVKIDYIRVFEVRE